MNKQTLLRQLPIALVVITAGIGIAQSATTGRVFPYVGYLEENGFPVDGERDMRINLYTAASGGNACQTVSFDGVTVANGRFKVDLEDVSDGCLIEGELYAALSVGPLGGALTDLTTGEGAGRVMIGAVPFAAASPKVSTFLVENDAAVGGNLTTSTLDVTNSGTAALDVTGNTRTGSLTVTGNATAGPSFIGDVGHGAGYAGFSHSAQATTNNYALLQSNDGANTFVNTSSTGAIRFRSANADRMVMDSAGNFRVNGNLGVSGHVLGAYSGASFNTNYTASSDGFVNVWIYADNHGDRCYTFGYVDGATRGTSAVHFDQTGVYANTDTYLMPVRRGSSWRVDFTNGYGACQAEVTWVPLAP